MVTLIINGGEPMELEAEPSHTVLDLLLSGQDQMWGEERVVDTLIIDGESIPEIEEELLQNIPVDGKKVEITLVQAPQRTLAETLAEAAEYLTRLEKGFGEVAGRIRLEGDPEAYKLLGEGTSGLSSMVEMFDALSNQEGVPEALQKEFKEFLTSLNEKSQELNDAQESQDPTLIADIIEYEMVEAVVEMGDLLKRFSSHFNLP